MNKRTYGTKDGTRWNLRVFGGTSHPELSRLVAKKAGVKLGDVILTKFANNETNVVVNEVVRGQNVYIIQTAGAGRPHDHLMEVLFMVNACRLSAAATITVVMPLFFYSQADNKDNYRMSITGKLVANMLKKAGVSKVMILDPRTPQLEGFFDGPIDAIKVEPLVSHWIRENVEKYKDCVVVCPDENGIRKVIVIADDLDIDHAVINSRLRNRADISDATRKQLRHNRLNHQHMSENWQIVMSEEDEEDEIHHEAERIERTLRISESYNINAKSLDSLSQGSCTSSSGIKGDGGSSCNDGDVDDEDDDRTTTSNTDAGDTDGAASFSAAERPDTGMTRQSCSHMSVRRRKSRRTICVDGDKPAVPQSVTAFARDCVENEEHQFLETRVSGDVSGKMCVLVDDVIDTGRGMKAAVEALKREGAVGVRIWATHGVLSPEAIHTVQNFDQDFVKSVTVTNSIPQTISKQILKDRLQVADISGLIAEAIRRHHYCESVAMISYCLNSQPLAKEPTGDGGSRKTSSNATAAATPKVVERTNSGGNASGILPRHPGLDRLRKPYRLSSKCWD